MTQLSGETIGPGTKEVGFYEPILPFKGITANESGKLSSSVKLTDVGEVMFYASPNIDAKVDAKKFFQNPRRVWAEIPLPDGTPQAKIDNLKKMVGIEVTVQKNQTVELVPNKDIHDKVVFELVHNKGAKTDNPLIEEGDFLEKLTVEVINKEDVFRTKKAI